MGSSVSVARIKREAKNYRKEHKSEGVSLSQAQEIIARQYGFASFEEAMEAGTRPSIEGVHLSESAYWDIIAQSSLLGDDQQINALEGMPLRKKQGFDLLTQHYVKSIMVLKFFRMVHVRSMGTRAAFPLGLLFGYAAYAVVAQGQGAYEKIFSVLDKESWSEVEAEIVDNALDRLYQQDNPMWHFLKDAGMESYILNGEGTREEFLGSCPELAPPSKITETYPILVGTTLYCMDGRKAYSPEPMYVGECHYLTNVDAGNVAIGMIAFDENDKPITIKGETSVYMSLPGVDPEKGEADRGWSLKQIVEQVVKRGWECGLTGEYFVRDCLLLFSGVELSAMLFYITPYSEESFGDIPAPISLLKEQSEFPSYRFADYWNKDHIVEALAKSRQEVAGIGEGSIAQGAVVNWVALAMMVEYALEQEKMGTAFNAVTFTQELFIQPTYSLTNYELAEPLYHAIKYKKYHDSIGGFGASFYFEDVMNQLQHTGYIAKIE